jgi:hypothetical protein
MLQFGKLCVGKIALFGRFCFENWHVRHANVYNVGWDFFVFTGRRNIKINSLKFAQSYQRAKSILISILSLSFQVVVFFCTCA